MHSESDIAFQEYIIVPKTDSVHKAIEIAHDFQKTLKKEIKETLGMKSVGIGDEGGFVLDTDKVEKPLELFVSVAKKLQLSDKLDFALDVAANSFYKNGKYVVDGKIISKGELLEIFETLTEKYPLISIEDPFAEESFESFAEINKDYDIIVGDDLTVTNKRRLQKAIEEKSIDALIIKPNQIGTLTETVETINLARENDIKCIASHRSGDTGDTFISDLAYAFGCFGIKAGALQRGERIAKYTRLMEIENLIAPNVTR